MSAVNIHAEGQPEAGTILGGGEGETEKEWQGCNPLAQRGLMCFFNAEPPPSGCWLVKQLSWFGFKPKESPQSVLNEKDMELEHTQKDSHQEYVCAQGVGE